MAVPHKKPVKRKEAQSVETVPDAWERFTKTVTKSVPPKRPKPKPRPKKAGS